jgi:hypothetical protein
MNQGKEGKGLPEVKKSLGRKMAGRGRGKSSLEASQFFPLFKDQQHLFSPYYIGP